jgi:hypothetical protein
MAKQFFFAFLLAGLSMQSTAQSAPYSATYITEGGNGVLKIKTLPGKAPTFTINVLGVGGHGCSLDGEISQGISVKGENPGEQCTVKFKDNPKGIEVISEGEDCRRMYCGMRAAFSSEHVGEYMKVSPDCYPENVASDRKIALQLYQAKRYGASIARLAPVLENCSKTLYWIDKSWIQNDLAVAYAKLNKVNECAKVLADLKGDSELTEEELQESYPRLEAELFWPVVKATKTNLKLCKLSKH